MNCGMTVKPVLKKDYDKAMNENNGGNGYGGYGNGGASPVPSSPVRIQEENPLNKIIMIVAAAIVLIGVIFFGYSKVQITLFMGVPGEFPSAGLAGENGYVVLTHEKFDRVLENALLDKIESELPLEVPDEYRKLMQSDIDHISMLLAESKNRFNPGFSGELNKDHLPPCIRTLLANAQNGVNLPHSGRFAMVSFLHAIGMNSDQILTLFSQSPDFDESKSSYQIRHITGELNGSEGYTPPECSTMKTNGICFEPDNLCNNDKVNHPLTYFRIKSGTRAPEAPKE